MSITQQEDYENLKTIVAYLNRIIFAGYNSDDPEASPQDQELLALVSFIKGRGEILSTTNDDQIIAAFKSSYLRSRVSIQGPSKNLQIDKKHNRHT